MKPLSMGALLARRRNVIASLQRLDDTERVAQADRLEPALARVLGAIERRLAREAA